MDYKESTILERIRDLWREGRFCDFTIKVGDKEFHCHKLILSAQSEYFNCMFNHSSVIESTTNVVTLDEIPVKALEQIINFWYHDDVSNPQIIVDDDNVEDLLYTANRLLASKVLDQCAEYMKLKLDIDNCLEWLITSSECNISKLRDYSLEFCLDNFVHLIDQEDLTKLPLEDFERLISNDHLNIPDEIEVCRAVIRWVDYHPQERSQYTGRLSSHIHYSLIDPVMLDSLLKESTFKYFQESFECVKQIALAFSNKMNRIEDRSERNPIRKQQRIYAVGGWPSGNAPTNTAEVYNRYKDTWTMIPYMQKSRCGVGVSIYDDSLYVIGGHDGQEYLADVERLDLKTQKWHDDVASMYRGRNSLGAVTHNGYIYAIGGQTKAKGTNSVERYDPKTNQWKVCVPMKESRLGLGVAVLNNVIYAVGGADTNVLRSVECLELNTSDQWMHLSPMLAHRKHFGCVSCNGKIYVVGGRGAENELKTAECYDPVEDKWTEIAPMKLQRSGIGLVAIDGLLYAIGGHNGEDKLNDVEVYYPEEDVWRTPSRPMKMERLGAGVAVYSKLCK